MKNLTFTQNELVKKLEELALVAYQAKERGATYGVSEPTYYRLFNDIDYALTEIRGRQIWYRGYIDDKLEFEECLTSGVVEYQSQIFGNEYQYAYEGRYELRIEGYDTETDEVVYTETIQMEVDNTPSITEGRG